MQESSTLIVMGIFTKWWFLEKPELALERRLNENKFYPFTEKQLGEEDAGKQIESRDKVANKDFHSHEYHCMKQLFHVCCAYSVCVLCKIREILPGSAGVSCVFSLCLDLAFSWRRCCK